MIGIIVLLLLRFVPALWGSLLLFVLVAAISIIGYGVYYWLSQQDARRNQDDDTLLRIEREIEACQKKANKYREETEAIRHRHRRLANQLEKSEASEPTARQKAEKMLLALDEELSLRLAKAAFFEESAGKLTAMLETHKLNLEIMSGEVDLERWRKHNYTDVADMEEMKDRIEREKTQLDTISQLAHRAIDSEDLNHTSLLRRKLKELQY